MNQSLAELFIVALLCKGDDATCASLRHCGSSVEQILQFWTKDDFELRVPQPVAPAATMLDNDQRSPAAFREWMATPAPGLTVRNARCKAH